MLHAIISSLATYMLHLFLKFLALSIPKIFVFILVFGCIHPLQMKYSCVYKPHLFTPAIHVKPYVYSKVPC